MIKVNAILVEKNNLSMNALKRKGIAGIIVTMFGRMKRVVGAGKNSAKSQNETTSPISITS